MLIFFFFSFLTNVDISSFLPKHFTFFKSQRNSIVKHMNAKPLENFRFENILYLSKKKKNENEEIVFLFVLSIEARNFRFIKTWYYTIYGTKKRH